ncbi:YebC/PmpR family DNA-binding transcriptional regulator [Synechococcales cyanobacterium C]|uniref:Probable transcriptional regulatory protein GS597_15940 n=1 Tax=Petrachloros mirabilis ULC683 TaxID=2781853 RepID=A0A8K2A9F0_9CYAN|nr:YebC/PmpR family DNA-binding transcriptional regulator [Petrachloros mirabilis]NCJ07970.1 YebC/PmpR family DNA-binding transcriptional regulator [Petrachloros mirabilis ULC683]
MAGHSKWANIKRQKARVDAKKGQVFARISRAIIVAARQGLPDPEANFQLRSAIEKAKAAGIPNDNIERAIAKGSGQLGADGDQWEDIRYEGYGPGGVAILIEAMTDNRNRTAADLRAAFSKNDGNLGETGCVGWMFDQKGILTISDPLDEEVFLEALVESGAETYELIQEEDEIFAEVCVEVTQLDTVAQALKTQGYTIQEAELRWLAANTVTIEDADRARKLLRLMDTLDELDDVQTVTANFELPEPLLAQVNR